MANDQIFLICKSEKLMMNRKRLFCVLINDLPTIELNKIPLYLIVGKRKIWKKKIYLNSAVYNWCVPNEFIRLTLLLVQTILRQQDTFTKRRRRKILDKWFLNQNAIHFIHLQFEQKENNKKKSCTKRIYLFFFMQLTINEIKCIFIKIDLLKQNQFMLSAMHSFNSKICSNAICLFSSFLAVDRFWIVLKHWE